VTLASPTRQEAPVLGARASLGFVVLIAASVCVVHAALVIHEDNRWLAARINSLRDPPVIDISNTTILRLSNYEVLYDERSGDSDAPIILQVIDNPVDVPALLSIWTHAAAGRALSPRPGIWVVATKKEPIGRFGQFGQANLRGLSRLMVIRDLGDYMVTTGIAIAPQTLVFSGTGRLTCVLRGYPDATLAATAVGTLSADRQGVLVLEALGAALIGRTS
jgi:hypothetical protein